MIFQLMYFSQAAETISSADFDAILEIANAANPQHGITGFLTFNGTEFIQFLEGPNAAVEQLLANIERDPRNFAMITLSVHEASLRSFPEWRMVRLSDSPKRKGVETAEAEIAPDVARALDRLNDRFRDSYRAYLAA